MIFKDPWILILLVLLPGLVYWIKKRRDSAAIKLSSGELIKNFKPGFKVFLANNLFYLRIIALALIIMALARPSEPLEQTKIYSEGVDIVLAVDASGSMLAEDFKINARRKNRLEVVKKVVEDFIRNRESDRIAMVAFAGRAYTVCPLTLDYDWLIKNLKRVEIGTIEDGTAVGSAISSSLNRLKDTKAKSKIIILLTDGMNNAGKISPLTAADAAKALGIKIYTIGAGSKGLVPFPAQDFWGRKVYQNVKIDIDEETLKKIAEETKAKYYRATDTESLREIYKEIDALEKTEFEEKAYLRYKELFSGFLISGLIFLILEFILSNTILRKMP